MAKIKIVNPRNIKPRYSSRFIPDNARPIAYDRNGIKSPKKIKLPTYEETVQIVTKSIISALKVLGIDVVSFPNPQQGTVLLGEDQYGLVIKDYTGYINRVALNSRGPKPPAVNTDPPEHAVVFDLAHFITNYAPISYSGTKEHHMRISVNGGPFVEMLVGGFAAPGLATRVAFFNEKIATAGLDNLLEAFLIYDYENFDELENENNLNPPPYSNPHIGIRTKLTGENQTITLEPTTLPTNLIGTQGDLVKDWCFDFGTYNGAGPAQ